MKLHAALGTLLTYYSTDVPKIGAAWTKALEIAESLDDPEYQLRSVRGLYMFHAASGRHRVALALAERFSSLAAKSDDPKDRLVGDRLIGATLHYLGDQTSARRHIECALADYVYLGQKLHAIRFQFDQRATAGATFAQILWLQGFPDQAVRTVENAVEAARAIGHGMSLCYALGLAACLIGRQSGCGGRLRCDAARPIYKAWAGALACLWPRPTGSRRQ
jgi:hypothetical protein